MSSPHDHSAVLRNLQAAKKEVQSMSTKPVKFPVVVEEAPAEDTQVLFVDDPEVDPFDELERELEAMGEAMEPVKEEPAPAPQMSQEEWTRLQVLETFNARTDKPSAEQIEAWKVKHGKESIQVISLDSENVYVYTHLTWGQWERIQKLSEQIQKAGNADADKAMREAIVKAAVLWPKLNSEFFQTCRAGLPATLMDLIMINSYFLTPQQSMSLTSRL